MHVIEPYSERSVTFIRLVEKDDWRLKVYGLSTGNEEVSNELVATALNELLPRMPQPASSEDRYGVGFVIVHRGTMRNWFTLGWWEYEDILFHRLFSSPLDDIGSVAAEQSAAIACVHELKIIHFESEAWIATALGAGGDPDFLNYLGRSCG